MNKTIPRSTRLYFLVNKDLIFEKSATFNYFSGFSISQKQKSIQSFHDEINRNEGDGIQVLEVSRKSENPLGKALSAFNLRYDKYTVESLYQSSKVFNNKIQLKHLLYADPLEAKREANEFQKSNNMYITHFNFLGEIIPALPESLFYDYLYVKAITQNSHISKELLEYNCFTDIEFNQKKQISSQARSCAIYVFLVKSNLISKYIESVDSFTGIYKLIMKDDFNLFST